MIIFHNLAARIGLRFSRNFVERLAARLVREGRIKRKIYRLGHEKGYAIGLAEGFKKAQRRIGNGH